VSPTIKNIPGLVWMPIEVSSLDWAFADVKTISWSISFFMFSRKFREKRLYSSELALAEQMQFLIFMFSDSSPLSIRVSYPSYLLTRLE
jgi:hypothetical protein